MSASSTEAKMCIFSRIFGAIVNSSGAWNWLASVWPGSILRSITTPSTGARICV